jgi:hypothetical protein
MSSPGYDVLYMENIFPNAARPAPNTGKSKNILKASLYMPDLPINDSGRLENFSIRGPLAIKKITNDIIKIAESRYKIYAVRRDLVLLERVKKYLKKIVTTIKIIAVKKLKMPALDKLKNKANSITADIKPNGILFSKLFEIKIKAAAIGMVNSIRPAK